MKAPRLILSALWATSSGNPIWAFAEDPDGSVWIGTTALNTPTAIAAASHE